MSCHATKIFKQEFPERFVNVGIAEQNMMGIAAGMSTMGKIPFAYSFAPFATRRCYDQIFISIAYAKQNVKIVGTDPGITAENNGGTHMPFEDMALMRAIPDMVCFEPTDATMMEKAFDQIVDFKGAVYIRLQRKKAEKVFDENLDFKLGKAITVKEGKDVTLIASGIMVAKALDAAAELEKTASAQKSSTSTRGNLSMKSNRRRGKRDGRNRHLREPQRLRRPWQRGCGSRVQDLSSAYALCRHTRQIRSSGQNAIPCRAVSHHGKRHRN